MNQNLKIHLNQICEKKLLSQALRLADNLLQWSLGLVVRLFITVMWLHCYRFAIKSSFFPSKKMERWWKVVITLAMAHQLCDQYVLVVFLYFSL